MYNTQKKLGNSTEKEFASLMYSLGWWVHIFADKVNGQPFDIVMSRNNMVWFLDAKHVQDKDYFLHSRIEDNQHNAFKMLINRGTTQCGFVCKFSDGWRLLKYQDIDHTKSKTHKDDMRQLKFKGIDE
jgi:hypothetical protein